ncbi:hypothetical protein [Massilia sp. BJB1822]|uniref:hypothetical protein n=1 Tax=Massilia sp. BJB1822 TaxID=2744470 RepID=UPI00159409D2|nr:hypothetical protein [Massilia sp. BJB1822]NVD97767.1 hypothetical protein [Massilia sp. BJB1822]
MPAWLSALVEKASHEQLTDADMFALCLANSMLPLELCDNVALDLTERYFARSIDWRTADVAMSHLLEWAYRDSGHGLSNFAWSVYSAFALGEDRHEGQPADTAADYFCLPLLQHAYRIHCAQRPPG